MLALYILRLRHREKFCRCYNTAYHEHHGQLRTREARDGNRPVGVAPDPPSGKYRAQIRVTVEKPNIALTYTTVEEAGCSDGAI